MKKLVIAILTLLMFSSCYADSFATLRMKISGPIKDNRYFLCVSGVGCVSILNGDKGHTYPLMPGEITSIRAINAANRSYITPNLPSSCSVTVNENQTLTVSGTIIEGSNYRYALTNLHCHVS